MKWIEIDYLNSAEINGVTDRLINCSKISDITVTKTSITIYLHDGCAYPLKYLTHKECHDVYVSIQEFLEHKEIIIQTICSQ